jgi:hypothetical protein
MANASIALGAALVRDDYCGRAVPSDVIYHDRSDRHRDVNEVGFESRTRAEELADGR